MSGYSLVGNNLLYYHMEEQDLERDKRRMISEGGLLEDKNCDSPPPRRFYLGLHFGYNLQNMQKLGPIPLKERKEELEFYP